MTDTPEADSDATDAARPSRLLRLAMYGIAGLLLLGACWVQLVAPDGATAEIPAGRRGRRTAEVGLWGLYVPFVLALLAAWYATNPRLPLERMEKRRTLWIILLCTGPAALFAILAYETLA